MVDGLGRASLVENARFNATVVVPNAVQGIFGAGARPCARRRRPTSADTPSACSRA